MVLQVLAENNSGGAPTADELAEWADSAGQEHPVLSDPGWSLSNRFELDYGIPSFSLLAPGMEVVAVDDWGAENMIADYAPDEPEE
ncbi:MAG: hypothetical protein GY913_01600 [Proteobacteria bacterium]|nr:hypothetical protein [Pseudomonadota bacterium]MCP4915594.1 hypothetical protein [Pseudomonadota bacterium]